MDNLQIAQEINTRIGNSPIPFDSVYSIALAIYQELGGEGNDFDSVYSILLEILPLASETAHVIDDSSISLTKTWSSSKISSELADAIAGIPQLEAGKNISISEGVISAADPIKNVDELPNAEENKDQLVRLSTDNNVYYSGVKEVEAIMFTALENSTVGLWQKSSYGTYQSSKDGNNWTAFTTYTNISLNAGEKLFVRGTLTGNNAANNYTRFKLTGKLKVSGNLNYMCGESGLTKNGAFFRLFYNNSALVDTSDLYLALENVANGAYDNCFAYCQINKINFCATAVGSGNPLNNWMSGVPATGTFVKRSGITLPTGTSGIPSGWEVEEVESFNIPPVLAYSWISLGEFAKSSDVNAELSTKQDILTAGEAIIIDSSNNISVDKNELNPIYSVTTLPQINKSTLNKFYRENKADVYYVECSSIEKLDYIKFTAQDNSTIGLVSLSTNQTLQYSTNKINWNTFDTTVSLSLSTDDIVYVRGILTADNSTSNYTQFNITGDVKVSGNINALWNYAAEDLGNNFVLYQFCGESLFKNCIGLTDASELILPSLIAVPYAYENMFSGCSGLVSAPQILATRIKSYYGAAYMFQNCTSLVNAPIICAALEGYSCFGMFTGCTSLTESPVIISDSIANYALSMAFAYCSNLEKITIIPLSWGNTASKSVNWVTGVASTGTFICKTGTSWGTGTSSCPSGWTKEYIDSYPYEPEEFDGYIKEYVWKNIKQEVATNAEIQELFEPLQTIS